MIELVFALPWCPSMNTYWRSMRSGRLAGVVLLSREAREYRKRVQALAAEQGIARNLGGSLEVEIIARPPDRRVRDLDNLLKPLLDSLIHAGVIEDDGCIDDLRIRRGPRHAPDGVLEVWVRQLAPSQGGQLELTG